MPVPQKCDPSITEAQMQAVEHALGTPLPDDLRRHYMRYNGGTIEPAYVPDLLGGPDELSAFRFISMLVDRKWRDDPAMVIPTRTLSEWEEGTVPRNLLPVAFYDDYICVDLNTGAVVDFHRYGKEPPRLLFNSFDAFLAAIQLGELPPDRVVANHPYWGDVLDSRDSSGYGPRRVFDVRPFEADPQRIQLGNSEQRKPTAKQLDAYAQTFAAFLEALPGALLHDIQHAAFDHYQKYYASYYSSLPAGDDDLRCLQGSALPTNAAQHFLLCNRVMSFHVLRGNTVLIVIDYAMDGEHGLEIRIKDNRVAAVGGIAET